MEPENVRFTFLFIHISIFKTVGDFLVNYVWYQTSLVRLVLLMLLYLKI